MSRLTDCGRLNGDHQKQARVYSTMFVEIKSEAIKDPYNLPDL